MPRYFVTFNKILLGLFWHKNLPWQPRFWPVVVNVLIFFKLWYHFWALHKRHLVKMSIKLHFLYKNYCDFSKTWKNIRYVFEIWWHHQKLVTPSNATYTKRCTIHWRTTMQKFLPVAFIILQYKKKVAREGIHHPPGLGKPKNPVWIGLNTVHWYCYIACI